MKLLFDFFPVLLFFIAYKFSNIYVATAVTMAASAIQVGGYWLKYRKFEQMHFITLILVMILGGATLLLHDDLFIKWKPTAIYWFFAIALFASQFIGKKPLIQRLLEAKVELPLPVWLRLNLSWAIFFAIMGIVNIYVLYHFSTNAWVNFKLFGTLGLTFLFVILQGFYMAKHVPLTTSANPKR